MAPEADHGRCPLCQRDLDSAEQRKAVQLSLWPTSAKARAALDPNYGEQLSFDDVD